MSCALEWGYNTCLEIFNFRGYIGGFTFANFRFMATWSISGFMFANFFYGEAGRGCKTKMSDRKTTDTPPQVEKFKTHIP